MAIPFLHLSKSHRSDCSSALHAQLFAFSSSASHHLSHGLGSLLLPLVVALVDPYTKILSVLCSDTALARYGPWGLRCSYEVRGRVGRSEKWRLVVQLAARLSVSGTTRVQASGLLSIYSICLGIVTRLAWTGDHWLQGPSSHPAAAPDSGCVVWGAILENTLKLF